MHIDYCIKAKNLFTAYTDGISEGCVLISGKKIEAVVPFGEEKALIQEDTIILDAGEGLVMPGFIDAHTHFFSGALAYSDHVCCEIEKSTSEEDCVRIIKEYADSHPDEKRIRGRGWFVTNWGTDRLPTKKSLDEAIPDRPVYLTAADCHSYWLNSKALEECGVTEDTEVSMGYIGKLENGELSGMLLEMEACVFAEKKYSEFSTDELKEIYKGFFDYTASLGVTSLSEMIPGEYDKEHLNKYKIIKEMSEDGDCFARLHLFTKLYDTDSFDTALSWKSILDNDYLKLSGVKGFIDGVAETYTALFLEPYSDREDTTGVGVPAKNQDELNESVLRANMAGLPVRIHAIGDLAVRMALDAFENAGNITGRHLANTIEHIESIDPQDIDRFRKLGVIPSMQPIHVILDADGKIAKVGEERIKYEWITKTLLESCNEIALGTDYPVVDINPFDNIYAAVTRKFFDGREASHNPSEKLTMEETLMGYTTYAARAYSREDEIGMIKEGMLADIIILDKNLLKAEECEIRDTKVLLTIVGGKIVYNAI